ncbi:MAG: zinc-binding dehydrogenase [Chloroflexi bacterium]|nr:zinc-binding dehydrogenase [Chloroflexota bacterium]MCL5275766.1 zinc-binding dehydrogenase [Chloroflexota bacterium]
MKAAIVEKPGVLVVRDIPAPEYGDYDALCEMLYGATCTGTDQHLIAGRFPWPVRYPTIIGHESIGRVVQVGKRVRNYKIGDLVTRVGAPAGGELDVNWGGYAQFGVARDHWAMRADGLPASAWNAYRINQVLPPDFDPAAATMIITWRETLSYLRRMGVNGGSSVLVSGTGGNGLSFAAHAHNRGAHTVVAVGSAMREEISRAVGADQFYDYRNPDLVERIAAAHPDGFDFIIDAVGKVGELDGLLPLVRHGGTVGIYGIDDWGKCALNPTRARGTFTFYNGGYDEEETHAEIVAMIQGGALKAGNWLDLEHPFNLTDINLAFDALRERKMIKAVIKLSN